MRTSRFILLLVGLLSLSTSAMAANVGDVPVHRPLMEEYTGTWCGWCVRGLVGMELLRTELGDEFCGVAYHNGDAMQVVNSSAYPNSISGYPSAYIDRSTSVDALYGLGDNTGDILSTMQQFANLSTIAGIDVTAQWTSEDRTSIDINVTTWFTTDKPSANYAINVMLIADDLYGTGSQWNQANYYSGYTAYANDRFLGPWVKKGSPVSGIHFNDVLVGTSGVVANSLPSTIVAYEDYGFNYTFTLAKLPKPSLIQNKDNLHVIAVVVDRTTRKALNANRCYIGAWVNPVKPGDVNSDGEVDILDVTNLIDYLLNGSGDINFENADLDTDNTISISDITAIIDIVLGKGE